MRTLLALCCGLAGAAAAETITGKIYCDNYFEFYFNGELVATDPMTFTPHQAVAVSFEWDGTSNKEYAIMCACAEAVVAHSVVATLAHSDGRLHLLRRQVPRLRDRLRLRVHGYELSAAR